MGCNQSKSATTINQGSHANIPAAIPSSSSQKETTTYASSIVNQSGKFDKSSSSQRDLRPAISTKELSTKSEGPRTSPTPSPPPFPTLASVVSFRTETPDSSFLLTTPSQRLSLLASSTPTDVNAEDKGFLLLHSLCQQRSSYLLLLKACRNIYSVLDRIYNSREAIRAKYRDTLDNCIYVLGKCIEQSMDFNTLYTTSENLRKFLVYYQFKLMKYTDEQFFKHLYLSDDLSSLLDNLIGSCLKLINELIKNISFTGQSLLEEESKESLSKYLQTTSVSPELKVLCNLQLISPVITNTSPDYITTYAKYILSLLKDAKGDQLLAWEQSIRLYLHECQQQSSLLHNSQFDIACIIPNISFQQLWRERIPDQSSVYIRELALYIDAELMKDESSLYLTPATFGYPSTTTSLVDVLVDIFGAIGKSQKEISVFELARFITRCEIYWSLVEVVSFWMQDHLLVSGTRRCIPSLSQLTPYFTHQSQSLLLRDEQYEVLQNAILQSPFLILFGMSQTGKTFRLRHVLDENVVKDKFHVVWIDCSHIDGAEDLQVAMLQAINAQLFLAQSQTDSILSDFSSWLNHWTKMSHGASQTTCLIFDHVSPSLLSSLQPFASLIGFNACKLVIVLRDVESMETLQYVLSTESGFATMITDDTSIIEMTPMSPNACRALIQSYQELAMDAQHRAMTEAVNLDNDMEETFHPDTTSGIASSSGTTFAFPQKLKSKPAPFALYGSLHCWNESLKPLQEEEKRVLLEREDSLVPEFLGLPGLITEYCYQHQQRSWTIAKRDFDAVSMLRLLTKEEQAMLKCVGGVIGILCAEASDASLMYRWRFTMKLMWQLWQDSTHCGSIVSKVDFLRWRLIWVQLIEKGLFKKVGVSLMVCYSAGEEYTLTREAMCLFSALLADSSCDANEGAIDVENILLAFLKQWLCEFYHVSQDIVCRLREDTVGVLWLDNHLELFRRIVTFVVRECQDSKQSQTMPHMLPLTNLQQEIVPYLVHGWCTFLSPCCRWDDLMPETTLFPLWLMIPTMQHTSNDEEKLNHVGHVLYFLWEMLSCLMHPHSLPEMKETMDSFLSYLMILRVDTTAVYWQDNAARGSKSTDHHTIVRVRSAIIWTMYEMGKLLWDLPDAMVSKDTVYDFLEDLRLVVEGEVKEMSVAMDQNEKASRSHSHKRKSGFKSEGLKYSSDEDLLFLLKRAEAEICLLLAKITAATIRRVNNGRLAMTISIHNTIRSIGISHSTKEEDLIDSPRRSVRTGDPSSATPLSTYSVQPSSGEEYHADNDDDGSDVHKSPASKSFPSPSKGSSSRKFKSNVSTPFASFKASSSKRLLQNQDSEIEQEDSLFCLSASAESTMLADPEVMSDFYNADSTNDTHEKQAEPMPMVRKHANSEDEDDESDHSNLVLLLDSYLTGYLSFFQELYAVKLPSPPPMLIATIETSNVNLVSIEPLSASTQESPIPPSPKDDHVSHPPALNLPVSSTTKNHINKDEIAFVAASPTSSFVPIRTNRVSRNSGGSLLGSAKTLSLRLMADPLIHLGDLFLQYFVPADATARTRCLFYYEQALQCLGKSRRESYDYDHFHYAQTLYHYARKVLGRYLLSAEASLTNNAGDKASIELKTYLRDEIMRNYMDIQRLLHQRTHFQVTEDVDACFAKTSYYLGMFWYQQQKFDEASWCFGQALGRLPAGHWLFESMRWLIADAAHYQGNSCSQRRKFADAITAYVHSLQTRTVFPPLADGDVLRIVQSHSLLQGTTFSALPSFYRNDSNLSALQNDTLHQDTPLVASTQSYQKSDREYLDYIKRVADTSYNLAFAYMKEKRYEDAVNSFQRALSCRRCYLSLNFLLPIAMTTAMSVEGTMFTSMSQFLDALANLYPFQPNDPNGAESQSLLISFASSLSRDHGLYSIESLSILSRLLFSLLPSSLWNTHSTSSCTPPPPPPSPTFTIILQTLDNLAQCQMQCKAFHEATGTYQESLQLKQKVLYPDWENVYSYGSLTRRGNVQSHTPTPVELHPVYFTSRQEIVATLLSLAWVHRQRHEYLPAWLWIEKAVSEAQKLVPFTSVSPSSGQQTLPFSRMSTSTGTAGGQHQHPRRSTANNKNNKTKGRTTSHNNNNKYDYGSGNEDSVTSGGSSTTGGGGGGGGASSVSSLISKFEDTLPQQLHHATCQQVIKLYVETLEAKAKLCEVFGSAAFPVDQLPHLSASSGGGVHPSPPPPSSLPTTREAFQRESVRLLQMARTQYLPWFGAQDAHVQELDKKLQSLWSKYG